MLKLLEFHVWPLTVTLTALSNACRLHTAVLTNENDAPASSAPFRWRSNRPVSDFDASRNHSIKSGAARTAPSHACTRMRARTHARTPRRVVISWRLRVVLSDVCDVWPNCLRAGASCGRRTSMSVNRPLAVELESTPATRVESSRVELSCIRRRRTLDSFDGGVNDVK